MDDKTLLRIALIGSILGIVALFFISSEVGVTQQVISTLDEVPAGQEVEVTGVVLRAVDKDKVMFLEIAEEKIEKTTVVLFKRGNISVSEGDVVTVTGSVEEYEGKNEVIGNKVEVR